MPSAEDVNPQKWSDLEVLFDNGDYSVVVGEFDGDHALGIRWNGSENGLGFPNQRGNPIWHVAPEFLEEPILKAIYREMADETLEDLEDGQADQQTLKYMRRVVDELTEKRSG